MLTEYNSTDAQRLQQARLARFQSFFLHVTATVQGKRLVLVGNTVEAVIQTNALLARAVVILGISRLEIFDADSTLVFAAELESEQLAQSEETMTELATISRSAEFDLTPTTAPSVVPWSRITEITGETEEELRSRLKVLGTPFYWSDDGWAVAYEIASQLIIRFRFEQGQREAAMLLGGKPVGVNEDLNGHNPPKPKKPEFQPLKKGITPTLEKYLAYAGDTETRQMEILGDIAEENIRGKRHLTKIISSYPPEIERPTHGEFQVAGKKLLVKRTKQLSEPESTETEETTTEDGLAQN